MSAAQSYACTSTSAPHSLGTCLETGNYTTGGGGLALRLRLRPPPPWRAGPHAPGRLLPTNQPTKQPSHFNCTSTSTSTSPPFGPGANPWEFLPTNQPTKLLHFHFDFDFDFLPFSVFNQPSYWGGEGDLHFDFDPPPWRAGPHAREGFYQPTNQANQATCTCDFDFDFPPLRSRRKPVGIPTNQPTNRVTSLALRLRLPPFFGFYQPTNQVTSVALRLRLRLPLGHVMNCSPTTRKRRESTAVQRDPTLALSANASLA